MNNFEFVNPVKIIFGKGMIKKVAKQIEPASTVMILYGGGSIKKNGVYQQVIEALVGHKIVEFSGIEPNPQYETCIRAAEMIKKERVDFLLSVGGGSVLDATKFIAAAAKFDGNPWDILVKGAEIGDAMPFGSVLTLPATASEMNNGAVISRDETGDKLAFSSDMVYPKFAVLDPETTYTLPEKQVVNGIIDTFVHVTEQYLTTQTDATLQDHMAEAILKTLITEGPKALSEPKNYEVRSNVMWAATWGLNGWIGVGVEQDWATHMIGHEITAIYGLDHAQTLAVILPGLLTVMKEQKAKKIARMGREVFGIEESIEKIQVEKTIEALEKFFKKLGVKTRFSEYGLNAKEVAEKVSAQLAKRGWKLGEKANITPEMVKQIIELRG